MIKKNYLILRDAKRWTTTDEHGKDIPMFIFNHDIKASTMPEGFFRYYGRIANGALWGIHSHKSFFGHKNFFDRNKNAVCIITMEALKYNWKVNKFMPSEVSPASKKDIKKCIKKRYGKAALNAYYSALEFN